MVLFGTYKIGERFDSVEYAVRKIANQILRNKFEGKQAGCWPTRACIHYFGKPRRDL